LGRETPSGAADTGADGDLDVTEPNDLFILGSGASATIIDADYIDRVFDIAAGAAIDVVGPAPQWGATVDNRTGHVHGGGIHNHGYLGLFWSALTFNFGGNTRGGGGDHEAFGVRMQGFGDKVLAHLGPVGIGGVDEVHAQLHYAL
jgi:hypothetical protein